MENLIIYGIVAIGVIVSIVRNYQKEAQKNKERGLNTPRPASSNGQGSNQSRPASAPFSRPTRTESERSYNDAPYELETVQTVSNSQNQYQTLTSMGYDYTQEGNSSLAPEYDEIKNEQKAFTQDINNNNAAQELQLETSEDLQRAFIHSIILERKY